MMLSDEEFMTAAFDLAKEALKEGEVPVGCVFVSQGKILSSGRNTVNATKNATRHAEMNAVDLLLARLKEEGRQQEAALKDCTLYVTVEPCIMCAEALGQLGLSKWVFGCNNDRFGGCGSVLDVLPRFKPSRVVKGLRADEAVLLLKQFYEGENPNAPSGKAKRKNNVASSKDS